MLFPVQDNEDDAKGVVQFPEGFSWGVATSAYQIEGSWNIDGRGPSIWDDFSHCSLQENGDVACDHYRRWREDVDLISQLGVQHYRFSISWSRVLPGGRISGGVNEAGIQFYSDLIDALLSKGIRPMVTLFHWDMPSALQNEFGGLLSEQIIDCFRDYAELCFQRFGQRVKEWITFNEPWVICVLGFCNGQFAPGRRASPGKEPYIVGHNILLAHAAAVALYRDSFKREQDGVIGITLNTDWWEPRTDHTDDKKASERAMDFFLGWFAQPIFSAQGDYPQVMRETCGDRLPTFTEQQLLAVRGSSDFFGLNTYSTNLATTLTPWSLFKAVLDLPRLTGSFRQTCIEVFHGVRHRENYFRDLGVASAGDRAWKQTDMGWHVVPWGIRKLLLFIQSRFSPEGGIIVTENGLAVPEPTLESAMTTDVNHQKNVDRIDYFDGYLREVSLAIKEGANCRAYTAWSLMDNYEWSHGYSKRFGLVWVDYVSQKRTLKPVAHWYAEVAKSNQIKQNRHLV